MVGALNVSCYYRAFYTALRVLRALSIQRINL